MNDFFISNKILKKLNIKYKITIFYYLFLSVLASLFEILGISMIIPVMELILSGNIKSFFIFNYINNFLSKFGEFSKVNIVLILLLIIYFTKLIITIFQNFYKDKQINKIANIISISITKNFLYGDFKNLLNKTSSDLIKNINSDTVHFTNFYFSYLEVFVQTILITFIVTFLLIINFVATITIFILISLILITHLKIFRPYLKKIGSGRSNAELKMINYIQIVFNSFKEIKILNIEKKFSKDLFEKIKFQYKKMFEYSIANSFIRPILEFLFILIIVIFLYIFLDLSSKNSKEIITFFSALIISIIRIMPSLNRLLQLNNIINYEKFSINLVKNNILKNNYEKKYFLKKIKVNFNRNIKFTNISFKYSQNAKLLLDKINFKIKKNSITVITGESGKGKTTIINLICGLLEPIGGHIFIDDKKLSNKNIVNWRNKISILSQFFYAFNDTIKNNIINFSSEKFNSERFEFAIKHSQLSKIFDNHKIHNFKIGERGSKLSGGQIQRIAIARALYMNKEILILDEPTSMLDKRNKSKIILILKKLKLRKTLIIVTHDNDLIKIADNHINLK